MSIAIYLAHLNPVTNAHVEIIDELKQENKVVVMPVRFLKEKQEINTKSFPFNFEIRKKMIESVFDNSVSVSSNYTFHAPFKKYFPPIISPKSWSLKKQILQGIESDYFTYTGDKAEGLMLKLYRLNPKVGIRKPISAKDVKNQIYAAVQNNDMEWKKSVPKNIAQIISENWDIITKFASGEDMTTRVAGMKFPKEGYNSK